MLSQIYKYVTPWAQSTKGEILKNRILGRLANYLYPIYCVTHPVKKNNKKNSKCNIIISLTSFPDRIHKVYLCINSLLRQTICADKIILWLAESQFPNGVGIPHQLKELEKKGLEIKFCADLKSYKKVFFSAQEYPDNIIVTADDDTLYPENWLEGLLRTSKEFPSCVVCYRAHMMNIVNDHFGPYKDWGGFSDGIKGPSLLLMPTGVGGVLYPAGYFNNVKFDYDAIKKLCPTADDLWLRIIGLKNNYYVVKVDPNSKEWFTIRDTQNNTLFSVNTKGPNYNDLAMKRLIDYYEISIKEIQNMERMGL